MDSREERRQEISGDMVERVERCDRVERPCVQLERGEVGEDEMCPRDVGAGASNLLRRDVDSGDSEAFCIEDARVRRPVSTPELEDACAWGQSRGELSAPSVALVADDAVAVLREVVGHRVVPLADDARARIVHAATPASTSTRKSEAAASARRTASSGVSAIAMTYPRRSPSRRTGRIVSPSSR